MSCPKCGEDNYRRADLRSDGMTERQPSDINICMCCGFEWMCCESDNKPVDDGAA